MHSFKTRFERPLYLRHKASEGNLAPTGQAASSPPAADQGPVPHSNGSPQLSRRRERFAQRLPFNQALKKLHIWRGVPPAGGDLGVTNRGAAQERTDSTTHPSISSQSQKGSRTSTKVELLPSTGSCAHAGINDRSEIPRLNGEMINASALPRVEKNTLETEVPCLSSNTLKKVEDVAYNADAVNLYNKYAKDVRFLYDKPNTRIPRNTAHSMLHTSRAALHGLAAINLYQIFSPDFVMSNNRISEQEFTDFSQIALLLHDSARENDGIDYWDKESGVNVYHHLTDKLHVDPDKARVVAEAVANKDFKNNKIDRVPFYSLSIDANNECHWTERNDFPGDALQSNLMSVIQFGDCLDIIRARDTFDPSYLSFVQEVGLDNPAAALAVKQLIKEARYLIEKQGMGRFSGDTKVQQQWLATDDLYLQNLQYVQNPDNHFALLPALINGGQLLSADQIQKFDVNAIIKSRYASLSSTDRALNSRKDAGMVWTRMVNQPTQKVNKAKKASKKIIAESNASLEIRKTYRQPGVQTRGGYLDKNGNPDRSVSMIGFGSPVFSPAGFLIDSPPLGVFSSISTTDSNTGRGKKRNLPDVKHSQQELQIQYDELLKHLQEDGGVAEHNEGLLRITKFDGILYTQDPTFCNSPMRSMKAKGHAKHPASPVLQAYYLQHEHEKQTGTKLPIYEYKGLADVIESRSFTDDNIVELWQEAASKYMTSCLESEKDISHMSINTIKKQCLEKPVDSPIKNEFFELDHVFPEPLQQKINMAIEQSRKRIIDDHCHRILAEITKNPNDVDRNHHNLLIPTRAMAITTDALQDPTKHAAVMKNLEATMQVRSLSSSSKELSIFVDLIEHIKPEDMYLPELKKAFLDCLTNGMVGKDRLDDVNRKLAKVFNFLKKNNQIDDDEMVLAMRNTAVENYYHNICFNYQHFNLAESLGLLESYLPSARSRYAEMLPKIQKWSDSYDIKLNGNNLVTFLEKAGLMDEAALKMIQEKAGMTDLYGATQIYRALSNLGDKTLSCRKAIVENLNSSESFHLDTLVDLASEISKAGDILPLTTFARLLGKPEPRQIHKPDIIYDINELINTSGELNRLFPESADEFNRVVANKMQSLVKEFFTEHNPHYLALRQIISAYLGNENSQLEINLEIVRQYLTAIKSALPSMNHAEKQRHKNLMIALEAAYPSILSK